jgi:aminopeptidase-like protein
VTHQVTGASTDTVAEWRLLSASLDAQQIGTEAYDLAARLFPLPRSLTGDGVRQTLEILRTYIPIETREVPTGTEVLDWTVPREWRLRRAYIQHADGRTIVDTRDTNLHVLGYSTPIQARLTLSELKPHLLSLPDQPDLIPYRTSYYAENWGFCLSHTTLLALDEGPYDVLIDAEHVDGFMTYGELLLPGSSKQEVLLTTHICHPSLANDNCSGLAVLTLLARALSARSRRYTYRILMAPGTIGALAWLAANDGNVDRIVHGLVTAGLGDAGAPTYKRSRRGDAPIDRIMAYILGQHQPAGSLADFSPYGYDERQYCSPGYNLPIGSFQRSIWGTYPEYHTSADNLNFISAAALGDSYAVLASAIDIIETDRCFLNLKPKGEPQLGRRGLYAGISGNPDGPRKTMGLLWVLNLSDGKHSLLDIAQRSGLAYPAIIEAADMLRAAGLLAPVTTNASFE